MVRAGMPRAPDVYGESVIASPICGASKECRRYDMVRTGSRHYVFFAAAFPRLRHAEEARRLLSHAGAQVQVSAHGAAESGEIEGSAPRWRQRAEGERDARREARRYLFFFLFIFAPRRVTRASRPLQHLLCARLCWQEKICYAMLHARRRCRAAAAAARLPFSPTPAFAPSVAVYAVSSTHLPMHIPRGLRVSPTDSARSCTATGFQGQEGWRLFFFFPILRGIRR